MTDIFRRSAQFGQAVVATCLLSACTSVNHMQRPVTAADVRRINVEADGHPVAVRVGSKDSVTVGGLHLEGDKLLWTTPVPGYLSASESGEVTVVRRGKGFWEGLGIGAGAGFATGLAIGVIWNSSCSAGPLVDGGHPQSSCPFSAGPGLVGGLQLGSILGALLAVPGAIIGGVVGAARGDRVVFTTVREPERR
jgi:hypothetical protein